LPAKLRRAAGVLAILRPYDEAVDILEITVKFQPGRVVFWRKDGGSAWGPGTDARDYYAVISLESSDPKSGVAFLDLEVVVSAFETGQKTLPDDAVTYVDVGAGGQYRPIQRGGNYIATPCGYDGAKYNGLAIIDAQKKTLACTVDVGDVARIQWVPDPLSP